MNSIGIIGFGRFGKILANILQKEFRDLLDLWIKYVTTLGSYMSTYSFTILTQMI